MTPRLNGLWLRIWKRCEFSSLVYEPISDKDGEIANHSIRFAANKKLTFSILFTLKVSQGRRYWKKCCHWTREIANHGINVKTNRKIEFSIRFSPTIVRLFCVSVDAVCGLVWSATFFMREIWRDLYSMLTRNIMDNQMLTFFVELTDAFRVLSHVKASAIMS